APPAPGGGALAPASPTPGPPAAPSVPVPPSPVLPPPAAATAPSAPAHTPHQDSPSEILNPARSGSVVRGSADLALSPTEGLLPLAPAALTPKEPPRTSSATAASPAAISASLTLRDRLFADFATFNRRTRHWLVSNPADELTSGPDLGLSPYRV